MTIFDSMSSFVGVNKGTGGWQEELTSPHMLRQPFASGFCEVTCTDIAACYALNKYYRQISSNPAILSAVESDLRGLLQPKVGYMVRSPSTGSSSSSSLPENAVRDTWTSVVPICRLG